MQDNVITDAVRFISETNPLPPRPRPAVLVWWPHIRDWHYRSDALDALRSMMGRECDKIRESYAPVYAVYPDSTPPCGVGAPGTRCRYVAMMDLGDPKRGFEEALEVATALARAYKESNEGLHCEVVVVSSHKAGANCVVQEVLRDQDPPVVAFHVSVGALAAVIDDLAKAICESVHV